MHEDTAIRLMLRLKGSWQKTGYPALVLGPWGDVIVGDDAKRLLPPNAPLGDSRRLLREPDALDALPRGADC